MTLSKKVKMTMNPFKDLMQHINNASYILIAGHISPDGDAIGACTAMGLVLKQMGKDYGVLLEEPDPKYNYMLKNINLLSDVPYEKCDLFISLDCADINRLGAFNKGFDFAKVSYNIDHHISNTRYGMFNYVDSNASSASEIVHDIWRASKVSMSTGIAEAIYTGIVYDTAAFKHTNTTSKTLAIASELLEYDFDFSSIIQTLFYERSFASTQLQGIAINNIESYYNDSLIVSSLSQKDFKLCNTSSHEAEGIVNVLKNIKNSKIALFLYEKNPGEVKVSMRSEDPYNVCEIANIFGGGGHKKAAGATICSTLEDAKNKVVPLLMNLFM